LRGRTNEKKTVPISPLQSALTGRPLPTKRKSQIAIKKKIYTKRKPSIATGLAKLGDVDGTPN